MQSKQPVVIVGAGPVGLALALTLSRYDVATLVLETRDAPTPETESRAVTWMPKGLEFLDWLGLSAAFEREAQGIHRTAHEFWDTKRRLVRLSFTELPTPFPYSLNLPQHHTEALLEQAALHSGLVEIRRLHTVVSVGNAADRATLVVASPQGEYTLESPWAVACDGAKSVVKQSLGIANHWKDYGTDTAVADFLMDCDLPKDESRIILDPARPYGFFYFGPRHWRLIYRINAGENRSVLTSEAQVVSLLNGWLPAAKVERLLWASAFRLGQGQSVAYRQGRWLLAGDAAHAMGPSLGAGMQVGMLGVWRLGWRLARAVQGSVDTGTLLREYEQEQRVGSSRVQKSNAVVFWNIALSNRSVAPVRSLLLQSVFHISALARRSMLTDTLLDQKINLPS